MSLCSFKSFYATFYFLCIPSMFFKVESEAIHRKINMDRSEKDFREKHRIPSLLSFIDDYTDQLEDFRSQESNTVRTVNKRSVSVPDVPFFMLELYNRLQDKKRLPRFNSARCFTARAVGSSTDYYASRRDSVSEEKTSTQRLSFDVSHFPATEKVTFAQWLLPIHATTHEAAAVQLFHVPSRDAAPRALPTHSVSTATSLWLAANLTQIFRDVLRTERKQLILELRLREEFLEFDSVERAPHLLVLSSAAGRPAPEDDPVLRRLRRSLHNRTAGYHISKGGLGRRRGRRSEEEEEEQEEQSNFIMEELGLGGGRGKGKGKRRRNPCRRRPMHVRFDAISYDRWIIAPPAYEAFECTGRCSFPMGAHLSPTKHAIVQALMHGVAPRQVARAACVPSRLAPISVLYVDEDGVVTYHYEYDEMVVAECGCR